MATTTTLEIDSTVEDGTTVLSLEPVSGAPDDNPWTDEVDEADETDDDSDSDSDAELEAAMDKAMDEAIEAALRGEGEGEDEDSKEDPPVEASNVPAIFKVIEIGNDKESLDAVYRLDAALRTQPDVAEAVIREIMPGMLKLKQCTERFRNAIVYLSSTLLADADAASGASMLPHVEALISIVSINDVDRLYIFHTLEQLLEVGDALSLRVQSAFRTSLFSNSDHMYTPEETIGVIETLESCISTVHLYQLAINAGAFPFIMAAASSPSVPVRIQVQKCLTQIMAGDLLNQADFEDGSPPTPTKQEVFSVFLQCAKDSEDKVAWPAVDFLISSDDEKVPPAFAADPQVVLKLVILLGRKENLEVIGAPAEWALAKLLEIEHGKAIKAAFEALWKDSELTDQTKMDVVRGLVNSFLDLRRLALEGGLAAFMMAKAHEGDISYLESFDKLMEGEQIVGYYIVKMPGAIAELMSIFSSTTSSPRQRTLIASILARLCDSFSPSVDSNGDAVDSEPQRAAVSATLIADDTLPRIVVGLEDEDRSVAGAVAELLAETLLEEEGTQSWSYDDTAHDGTGPPPCPGKEKILASSPTLLHNVITLLNYPESKAGALNLLSQFCWGYPPGQDSLRVAFEPFVPSADVFFWDAFYGEFDGRRVGRKRRTVAEAAVQAGALPYAFALLEKENQDPHASLARRSAAVEGLRCLLCADSVDVQIARDNKVLPVMLLKLLADVEKTCLDKAMYMLRLLEKEEDAGGQGWIKDWVEAGFGSEEMITSLVSLLGKYPYTWDPERKECPQELEYLEDVDEESEDRKKAVKEYNRLLEIWQDKYTTIRTLCEKTTENVLEVIRLCLPALGPLSAPLLPALLSNSGEISSNSDILVMIRNLAQIPGISHKPTVYGLQSRLASSDKPSASQILDWISCGKLVANAAEEAGVGHWLLVRLATPDDEVDFDRSITLSAFGNLVKTCDDDKSQSLKKAFFDNASALENAIKCAKSEDVWDASRSIDGLSSLCLGSQTGFKSLVDDDLVPVVLRLFANDCTPINEIIPFLTQLVSSGADDMLTECLRGHISTLSAPPEPATKKKGKKKKTKRTGLNDEEVWKRLTLLSQTTPEVRNCLVEAGAIEDAKRLLDSNDRENWSQPLVFLKEIMVHDTNYHEKLGPPLERLGELLLMTYAPATAIMGLVMQLVPGSISFLITTGVVSSLVRSAASDFTSSYENCDDLVSSISKMAASPSGLEAVSGQLRSLFDEEAATDDENTALNYCWLARKLSASAPGARAVYDAGGVEYFIRVMKSENVTIVSRGATASAVLSLSSLGKDTAMKRLLDAGVIPLIEKAHAIAVERAGHRDHGLEDPDEAYAANAECDKYDDVAERMSKALSVLKGECSEFIDV